VRDLLRSRLAGAKKTIGWVQLKLNVSQDYPTLVSGGSREAAAEQVPHARSPAAGGLRGDSGWGALGVGDRVNPQ